jgi:hypothetical protein
MYSLIIDNNRIATVQDSRNLIKNTHPVIERLFQALLLEIQVQFLLIQDQLSLYTPLSPAQITTRHNSFAAAP